MATEAEAPLEKRPGFAAIVALDENDARYVVALGENRGEAAGRLGASEQQVDKETTFEAGHLSLCPCEGSGPSSNLPA